jgi:hypothetical protein
MTGRALHPAMRIATKTPARPTRTMDVVLPVIFGERSKRLAPEK